MVLIGLDSNDVASRQAIVYKLLNAVTSGDGKKVYSANRLLQFTAADFTQQAKEVVQTELRRALLLTTNSYQRRDFILLAGVADLKSELPLLKQFIEASEEKLKRRRAREVEEIEKSYGGDPNRLW